ncbi:MAG: T9SS type A sorting domain-containing protein, partial [Methanococcaceae archaeon]
ASVYNINIQKPRYATSVKPPAENKTPTEFGLGQNYPNPFNPSTRISYNITKPGTVKLNVFDVMGRHVKTLVDTNQQSGNYSVIWNGVNDLGQKISSGIYFYSLSSNEMTETKKMILLK